MTGLTRPERDAVKRMRSAMFDLIEAKRFTEANDLLEIIERIDPPPVGEAAGSGLPVARTGRSESASASPVASAPATFTGRAPWQCGNCRQPMAAHCTTHLLPCCPGSLMHGQDEGTWTSSVDSV